MTNADSDSRNIQFDVRTEEVLLTSIHSGVLESWGRDGQNRIESRWSNVTGVQIYDVLKRYRALHLPEHHKIVNVKIFRIDRHIRLSVNYLDVLSLQ